MPDVRQAACSKQATCAVSCLGRDLWRSRRRANTISR